MTGEWIWLTLKANADSSTSVHSSGYLARSKIMGRCKLREHRKVLIKHRKQALYGDKHQQALRDACFTTRVNTFRCMLYLRLQCTSTPLDSSWTAPYIALISHTGILNPQHNIHPWVQRLCVTTIPKLFKTLSKFYITRHCFFWRNLGFFSRPVTSQTLLHKIDLSLDGFGVCEQTFSCSLKALPFPPWLGLKSQFWYHRKDQRFVWFFW